MPRATELRTSSEKALFRLGFLFSLIVWLAVVITIIPLIYGLMIGLFLYIAHALMIAHVKGNGVRISAEQFPDLHKRITEAARKLGLEKTPDAYVVQAGGALNAFATKFSGRNFMVIFSDLLEASDKNSRDIDMIIGHELGHVALGHLKWIWFLLPAKLVPWLGPAYSRACEYSCDRCGYEAAGDLNDAARGLAILAAGGRYGRQINLDVYMKQAEETSGFWTSVYELNATHPFLPKRIAAIVNHIKPGTVPKVRRHLLAYPLAPVFSFGSGPGAGAMMVVAVIAIMAAIAIPQFHKYRALVQQKTMGRIGGASLSTEQQILMDSTLQSLSSSAKNYRAAKGAWPCTLGELNFPEISKYAKTMGWELEVSCKPSLGSIIYDKGGKKVFRVIHFDSGKIEDVVM